MKKVTLLLMALVLAAVQAWALPVDASAAHSLALDFLTGSSGVDPTSVPSSGGSGLQLLHAEASSVNVTLNAYYIYNTGNGFVIVAGDDRAEQVLGYGDTDLDMNDIPCAMQYMLDCYKEQIDYLLEHPGLVVETPSLNAPMLSASSVSPLLTANWAQRAPFYNQTPVYNGSQCVTGCSCTSLCQVMYYWKHPTAAVPSLPAYTTKTLKISVPALSSTTFDWADMIDSYDGNYTTAQAEAVAKLMRYVGQAEKMNYRPDGSGAPVSGILETAILFGYDHNAQIVYKADFTNAQWASKIQAELSAGRPIVYAGWSGDMTSGHAFNIDGYNSSKNKYHINWGWGGYCNGYFALNAFNPSNYQFNTNQQMIIGIKPQVSEIEVDPTSVSFSAIIGETKTATINVKGYALTGNLTVKLNNGGTIYKIDKTSITKSAATDGATIKVTYTPTEGGPSSASVTISGGGAQAKTVTLSGTATKPQITVSPTSLSFYAHIGETDTETFTVTGTNLTGNLSVKLNDNSGNYLIDKTAITKSAATNGAIVTVTYCPTEVGETNASVTISGGGADSKTVTLSGTAVKPEITVSPASLSFSAIVGETVTQTFTVKGSDLTGALTLTLNNGGSVYSIDKTRINMVNAIIGTTVTVTYSPMEEGMSNASVTISGGGADAKTVELTGTAVKPEIIVSPASLSFSANVGETITKTFTVKGTDLTGNLTLTLNDGGTIYSIDKTAISWRVANSGATVTVTYSPTEGGTSNASVTISGGGADAKTVYLSGTAVKPEITTDVTSVAIDPTYTGYEGSRTILVTGTDLVGNIELSYKRDLTNSFALSKYTITPEEAAKGVLVTVYFYPMTAGYKYATLEIKSEGAETVSIPVSGTGIKSDGYIFASSSNLSFETQVGTPVTQTFRVTFSAPNGSVMISRVDGDGAARLDVGGGNDGSSFNAVNNGLGWNRTIIPFDGEGASRNKDWFIIPTDPIIPIFPPIEPIFFKRLVLTLTGDDCFDITPKTIDVSNVPTTTYVTVTYNPDCVGEHEAVISIELSLGSARPVNIRLHGTATDQYNTVNSGIQGNNMPLAQSTDVNELAAKTRVYADGHNIIIESPVEQSAYISDISGRAKAVNLQTGRNEFFVNASGVYVVRFREKSIKLVIK